MDWRNPSVLFWLLPISLLWLGCFVYATRQNAIARDQFLDRTMSHRLMPELTWVRLISKGALQLIGVVFLMLAIAGPQYGDQIELTTQKGSDLYVLLDVSRSMLGTDVAPTRLERAKADISSLVNGFTGERIGLIAFAGQAVVKCPLTVDYDSFRRALSDLDTNSAPRGGTAIGDAIRKAIEVFSTNSQRHQAILLITDGDDQQSAPLEAAEVAAERSVNIFAVGLGDTSQGARVPSKEDPRQFVEYEGEQIWSKLDNTLLEQIATKTSGVYIPAGTKSFDLKQIYTDYLADRDGDSAETQKRTRKADQYQWFLFIAIVAFLSDVIIRPFRSRRLVGELPTTSSRHSVGLNVAAAMIASVLHLMQPSIGLAVDDKTSETTADRDAKAIVKTVSPGDELTKGIKLYGQERYEEASQSFASAGDVFRDKKDDQSYVAIFDQACAEHRLGSEEKAVDLYLQAAMSRDRSLAAKAKFNLGRLHVDSAQKRIQGKEDTTDSKERDEIVDLARQAIAAYRHSLELDETNVASRRNIELVRQWLKVTTDRWKELDLKKRREEANLIQFLEYMSGVQSGIQSESKNLKDLYGLDRHAELKRLQDDLLEEFPYLRDKLEDAISPPPQEDASSPPPAPSDDQKKALEQLQSWVDIARDHMRQSSRSLGQYRASESLPSQQGALDELDKVWNAVAPFGPTLSKALSEQTTIAKTLKPTNDEEAVSTISEATKGEQIRTLSRSKSLVPKAQMELENVKNAPSEESSSPQPTDSNNGELSVAESKEKLSEALQKAIELAPKAVDEMNLAIDMMSKGDRSKSWEHAEEARKILEEIAKSQPPPPPQQNQNQDSQENQDQSSDAQNNKDMDEKEQEQRNSQDQDKQDDRDQSDNPKDGDQKEEPEQNKDEKESKNSPSKDRIAEALRKVREREAEKRDRDKKLKARVYGAQTVEKDW